MAEFSSFDYMNKKKYEKKLQTDDVSKLQVREEKASIPLKPKITGRHQFLVKFDQFDPTSTEIENYSIIDLETKLKEAEGFHFSPTLKSACSVCYIFLFK
jgi:hypothetical protein